MCGIIAFSGKSKSKFNLDKLQLLILMNQYERGKDSFGYWTKDGLEKTGDSAAKYLEKYTIYEHNTFIGHVRASTVGTISKRNAHPFQSGDIVAVHNGTLINHRNLFFEYKVNFSDWHVDSEIFAVALNKDKNPEIFSKAQGAMAVVFTDVKSPEKIYVYRNDERPLYYGFINEDMYISSLSEALSIICCENIEQFETEKLYTIKYGEIISTKTIMNFGEYYNKNLNSQYSSNSSTIATKESSSENNNKFYKLNNKALITNHEVRNMMENGKYYFVTEVWMSNFKIELKNNNGISRPHYITKDAFLHKEHLILSKGDLFSCETEIISKKDNNMYYAKIGDNLVIEKVLTDENFDFEVYNLANPSINFYVKGQWVKPIVNVVDYIED